MAQDYPNGLPYGATLPPYGVTHPHRGQDYLYPWGADINVEGTVIGKAGATGLTYDAQGNKGTKAAAHLHVQEWSGNVANVRKPQNAFKGGTVTVVSQSSDFGNYVTIQNADGWNDTYCHLSQVNVKPGQVIGDDMASQKELDETKYKLAESEKALRVREEEADKLKYQLSESEKALRNREQQAAQLEAKIDELSKNAGSEASKKLDEIKKIVTGE